MDHLGFPKLSHHIKQHYSTRYGVETGEVNILVHALPMSGRKYVMGAGKGRITLEKQWHNISQPFALQAIVKDILVEDPGSRPTAPWRSCSRPGPRPSCSASLTTAPRARSSRSAPSTRG